MSTLTINNIRRRARREVTSFTKNANTILFESVAGQSPQQNYHIFLSHSFRDSELILGTKLHLEDHGYSVYIDWIDDPQLDRSKVTKRTATQLRNRMDCCSCLFYATTPSSGESKWMPWECGYMDGKKGRSAILPLTTTGIDPYSGQEYLGIYPFISEDRDTSGDRLLWVNNSTKIYCSLDDWLKGGKPKRH